MSAETRRFQGVMRIMTVVYAVGALIFFFLRSEMEVALRMPIAPSHFWVTLAMSMMAMLSFLSWQSGQRPSEAAFTTTHLLSKCVSVSGFLFSFVFFERLPAYLIGAVTDSLVIVIVLYFYRRMNAGREPARVRVG